MGIKKISKWVLFLGALTIWAVKFGFRPYCNCDQPLRFFLGITPNLFGSFVIPFGACYFFSGRNNLLARIFRIDSLSDLRIVCTLGFGMLVCNEYLQLVPFFGRTFDYYDILFSAVGLTISYFVFAAIYSRTLYQYYQD